MKIRIVFLFSFLLKLIPGMKSCMVNAEFLFNDQRKRTISIEAGRKATLRSWRLISILKGH